MVRVPPPPPWEDLPRQTLLDAEALITIAAQGRGGPSQTHRDSDRTSKRRSDAKAKEARTERPVSVRAPPVPGPAHPSPPRPGRHSRQRAAKTWLSPHRNSPSRALGRRGRPEPGGASQAGAMRRGPQAARRAGGAVTSGSHSCRWRSGRRPGASPPRCRELRELHSPSRQRSRRPRWTPSQHPHAPPGRTRDAAARGDDATSGAALPPAAAGRRAPGPERVRHPEVEPGLSVHVLCEGRSGRGSLLAFGSPGRRVTRPRSDHSIGPGGGWRATDPGLWGRRGLAPQGMRSFGAWAPRESLHRKSQNARAEEGGGQVVTRRRSQARPGLRAVSGFRGDRSLGPASQITPPLDSPCPGPRPQQTVHRFLQVSQHQLGGVWGACRAGL